MPQCEYVYPKNRAGDRFACLHFWYESCVDRVWVCNLKKRDQRSGDIPVDTVELAACNAFGGVYL
ncbi:hypothetical protein MFUM_180005 [Methylacidiphilum fumariolicum SolV]|uniref:Uncharacterized protein n=2 Tax=Candidatus Methylacidiphilum fumarolicum TaxID=591154 RepID=I0JWL6_METFB|nr:conserved protein of unknown function [Candidatus Methylacidiphilum fumarolicum]CCG91635.1 hypothetical protein MFUM_180005 [Methylacidiphilum fumariolicum SolV]